jgi:hypothetical protein
MSRESMILSAATAEPSTTSELYDRIGYPALLQIGLIPYEAFRGELARLAALGMLERGEADDGTTTWQLPG